VRAVARARLCGVWLFGSAALGDFDPECSDLDVQAVTRERLTVAERRRLAAELSHDALPCPVRGLEFVLYAREDLTDPAGPAFTLNLNTGPRMAHHVALDAGEDPRFWFVLDVAIGRERGRPLVGPPPGEVFPELPRPLVVSALRDSLDWHAAHDDPSIAAARALAWAADGRWRSKAEAARWLVESARSALED